MAAGKPESAKDFSAACYFLVRDLRATEKVPVGAIDDSWGGTPIRAWMDEAAVRASGGARSRRRSVDLYRSRSGSRGAAVRRRMGRMVALTDRRQSRAEPWNASGRLTWKAVPSLTYWDSWGPEWKAWIGAVWLRERVTLTAAEAAQTATLSLSAVDDMDQTFVNGIAVGGKNDPANPRSYPLPKGMLKPGAERDHGLRSQCLGPRRLRRAGGQVRADASPTVSRSRSTSGWEYSRIADLVGEPPVFAWVGSSGVSTIYNAMVAPLGSLPMKGVAWYQGEADVGQPGYDNAWRRDGQTGARSSAIRSFRSSSSASPAGASPSRTRSKAAGRL